MSTYNTTYNFNQGNMNFGQALLYGAFGSLTGGMGCFGGGYGMGMMSPFGMGGSLFSMMGVGGYGMGYGCDSMIGAQVGMSMANLAYGAISQAIEGRGGSGSSESTSDKMDKIKSNAKEPLAVLNKDGGTYKLSDCDDSLTVAKVFNETTYNKNIQDAARAASDALGYITNATEPPAETEANKNNYSYTIGGKTYTDYTNAKNAYYANEAKKAKFDALQNIIQNPNNITVEQLKSKGIEDASLTSAIKQKEERKAEINNALNTLKELNKQHQILEKQLETEKLNKADGNTIQRISDEKYEKLLKGDRLDESKKKEVTKGTVRKAIYKLRNADSSDRVKYAQQVIDMYDAYKTNCGGTVDSVDLRTARSIAQSILDENERKKRTE